MLAYIQPKTILLFHWAVQRIVRTDLCLKVSSAIWIEHIRTVTVDDHYYRSLHATHLDTYLTYVGGNLRPKTSFLLYVSCLKCFLVFNIQDHLPFDSNLQWPKSCWHNSCPIWWHEIGVDGWAWSSYNLRLSHVTHCQIQMASLRGKERVYDGGAVRLPAIPRVCF